MKTGFEDFEIIWFLFFPLFCFQNFQSFSKPFGEVLVVAGEGGVCGCGQDGVFPAPTLVPNFGSRLPPPKDLKNTLKVSGFL